MNSNGSNGQNNQQNQQNQQNGDRRRRRHDEGPILVDFLGLMDLDQETRAARERLIDSAANHHHLREQAAHFMGSGQQGNHSHDHHLHEQAAHFMGGGQQGNHRHAQNPEPRILPLPPMVPNGQNNVMPQPPVNLVRPRGDNSNIEYFGRAMVEDWESRNPPLIPHSVIMAAAESFGLPVHNPQQLHDLFPGDGELDLTLHLDFLTSNLNYNEWLLQEALAHHHRHMDLARAEQELEDANREQEFQEILLEGINRRTYHLGQPIARWREGEQEELCSICLEAIANEELITRLDCDHEYHPTCIKDWVRQRNACPVCRRVAIPPPNNS